MLLLGLDFSVSFAIKLENAPNTIKILYYCEMLPLSTKSIIKKENDAYEMRTSL